MLVQKEMASDVFERLEESNLEPDSLIKCRIVKKGTETSDKYQVDDLILISADKVRRVKYPNCEDIFVIYNEDLIFCKLKK
jgi:hypothetical protein